MKVTYTDVHDYRCDFCNKVHKDTYYLNPDCKTDEFDILMRDFGKKFEDCPVLVVCENCLQGHCGAVPGQTPTVWFKNIYPKLILHRRSVK